MNRYLTEFIGTFFLVLTIGLSGNALAIGLALTALVYMGGHVSGAHYNPAVSLAIFFRKQLSIKDLGIYMIMQILGGLAAGLVIWLILGNTFAPAPAPNVDMLKAIVIELLYTFALALVVLNVATTKKNEGNSYYGIAIGFTVLAAAYSAGPITGGAFNPAVAIGPMIVNLLSGGNLIQHIPIYVVGPFLGGVLAAIVFKIMNPIEFKDVDLQYHETK